MTILCALQCAHGIYIGSDTESIASGDFGGRRCHHGPKWAVHGQWAVGVSGQMRLQCLIARHMRELTEGLESPLEFTDRLINEIFVRYDIKSRAETGAPDCGSNFMLAGPLGVIDIDCTLSVRLARPDELIASGCGAPYALGAAYALSGVDVTPVAVVKHAVGAAIAFDTGCGGDPWVHLLEVGR